MACHTDAMDTAVVRGMQPTTVMRAVSTSGALVSRLIGCSRGRIGTSMVTALRATRGVAELAILWGIVSMVSWSVMIAVLTTTMLDGGVWNTPRLTDWTLDSGEPAGIMFKGMRVISNACVRVMMAAVVLLPRMPLTRMRAVEHILTLAGLLSCGVDSRLDGIPFVSKSRERVVVESIVLELGVSENVSQRVLTKEEVLLGSKDRATWTTSEQGIAQLRTLNVRMPMAFDNSLTNRSICMADEPTGRRCNLHSMRPDDADSMESDNWSVDMKTAVMATAATIFFVLVTVISDILKCVKQHRCSSRFDSADGNRNSSSSPFASAVLINTLTSLEWYDPAEVDRPECLLGPPSALVFPSGLSVPLGKKGFDDAGMTWGHSELTYLFCPPLLGCKGPVGTPSASLQHSLGLIASSGLLIPLDLDDLDNPGMDKCFLVLHLDSAMLSCSPAMLWGYSIPINLGAIRSSLRPSEPTVLSGPLILSEFGNLTEACISMHFLARDPGSLSSTSRTLGCDAFVDTDMFLSSLLPSSGLTLLSCPLSPRGWHASVDLNMASNSSKSVLQVGPISLGWGNSMDTMGPAPVYQPTSLPSPPVLLGWDELTHTDMTMTVSTLSFESVLPLGYLSPPRDDSAVAADISDMIRRQLRLPASALLSDYLNSLDGAEFAAGIVQNLRLLKSTLLPGSLIVKPDCLPPVVKLSSLVAIPKTALPFDPLFIVDRDNLFNIDLDMSLCGPSLESVPQSHSLTLMVSSGVVTIRSSLGIFEFFETAPSPGPPMPLDRRDIWLPPFESSSLLYLSASLDWDSLVDMDHPVPPA